MYETLGQWASQEVRTVANLAAIVTSAAARERQQKDPSATESRGK